MDPQQRLLIECTEEALTAARLSVLGAVAGERAEAGLHYTNAGWFEVLGLPPQSLPAVGPHCPTPDQPPNCCVPPVHLPAAVGEGVGVFVGISTPDYSSLAQAAAEISAYSATGTSRWGNVEFQ